MVLQNSSLTVNVSASENASWVQSSISSSLTSWKWLSADFSQNDSANLQVGGKFRIFDGRKWTSVQKYPCAVIFRSQTCWLTEKKSVSSFTEWLCKTNLLVVDFDLLCSEMNSAWKITRVSIFQISKAFSGEDKSVLSFAGWFSKNNRLAVDFVFSWSWMDSAFKNTSVHNFRIIKQPGSVRKRLNLVFAEWFFKIRRLVADFDFWWS